MEEYYPENLRYQAAKNWDKDFVLSRTNHIAKVLTKMLDKMEFDGF